MTDTKTDIDAATRLSWQFANRVFAFLLVYCAVICALLILNGFHFLGFALSETVLVLLVCSVIATAFGLLIAALRSLFGPLKPRD